MVEVPLADLNTLYGRALHLYKGDLTHVREVGGDYFTIRNLIKNEIMDVPFVKDHFKPLVNRIGMVNILGHSAFISRTTVRQYSVGITTANLKVCRLEVPYSVSWTKIIENLRSLESKALVDAYLNKYPSLADAFREVSAAGKGCMAFDKQFAVTFEGYIIYKYSVVGKLVNGTIVYNDGYQYLVSLLENGYEKTTGTSRIASIGRVNRN